MGGTLIERLGLAGLATAWALTFALVVTPWGAPDEPQHYEYVQALVRLGRIPAREDMSLEAQARIVDSMAQYDYWRLGQLPRHAWGFSTSQLDRPPAPYLLYLPAYLASPNPDPAARLVAMRLVSVLLAGATTFVVATLAAMLFPDDPLMRVGPPLLAALTPQAAFIAGSVNSDNLANFVAAAAFLALVVAVRPGARRRDFLLVAALLVIAIATKRTTLYLVPLAGLAAVWCVLWRGGGLRRGRYATAGALLGPAPRRAAAGLALGVAAGLALGLPGAAAAAGMRVVDRWIANQSLANNLALYTLPGRDWSPRTLWGTYTHQARVMFESYWGIFGWMNVRLEEGFYVGLMACCGLALLGLALLVLGRAPSGLRLAGDARRAVVLAAAAVPLVMVPIVAQQSLWFAPGSFPQGRYLFTALAPTGLLAAVGLAALVPQPARRISTVAVAVGLVVLNAAALVGYVWPAYHPGASS